MTGVQAEIFAFDNSADQSSDTEESELENNPMQEEPCPLCGEPTKKLPDHLPHCDNKP